MAKKYDRDQVIEFWFGKAKVKLGRLLDWYKDGYTVQDIMNEPNAEVRRLMILLPPMGGVSNFIKRGGGKLIKKATEPWDDQKAKLWELNFGEGESYKVLEVVNSTKKKGWNTLTPEQQLQLIETGATDSEGYEKYFLQFNTNTRKFKTMYDMIGHTFGFKPGTYKPGVET